MYKSKTLSNILTMPKTVNLTLHFYFSVFISSVLLLTSFINAQEIKTVIPDTLKTEYSTKPNSPQAEEGDVKITDGTNTLIRITDEGTFGAIEIKNGVPSTTTDKLYNDAGTLKFNGSSLGGGSGATEINDLTDARYDGYSLYLGEGAGVNSGNGINYNTAVGKNALYTNTTGFDNTAIGRKALYSNLGGSSNTAVGVLALQSNSTGTKNTAIGLRSLYFNTSGYENVASGVHASYYNSTGHYNTVSGYQALYYNSTGSNNTVIGYKAGYGAWNKSQTGNILIGYQAGYNEIGSNKLYIENSNSSSPLIWGDFANDSVRVNGTLDVTSKTITPLIQITTGAADGYVLTSDTAGNATWQAPSGGSDNDWTVSGNDLYSTPTGNVGIGTTTPSTKLDVNGKTKTAQLQITTGATDGYVLTSDAAGNATWQVSAGGAGADSINQLADAIYDGSSLFLGAGAGVNDDGTTNKNTAVGKNALYKNTTGSGNTANGYNALFNNTTGNSNTANGYNALLNNTTGSLNTANGLNALFSNTTGSSNTANGSSVLYTNSTGSFNTGTGNNALRKNTTGDYNTANGHQALYSNTSGNNNTANGSYALLNNTTGNYNLANGGSALSYNTTGNYNTANGYKALYNNTTGINNTANGANALISNTTGSNNVGLGYSANKLNQQGSRNTIIGSEAGQGTALHNKSGNVFLGYKAGYYETGDNKLYIQNDSSSSPLIWGDFANNLAAVHGKLGISTKSPTSKIDIDGSNGFDQLRMRASYTPTSSSDTNGEVGDTAWDDNYFYIKTNAGWKRTALSTF